jgi:hypothetical protein
MGYWKEEKTPAFPPSVAGYCGGWSSAGCFTVSRSSFAFAEESEISFTDHLCGPHVASDDINVDFSVGGDNHGSRNALWLQHGIQSASFKAGHEKEGKSFLKVFFGLFFGFTLRMHIQNWA